MLKTEEKKKLIEKHKVHETDTGSPEVQIGLLSEEIDQLVSHLKTHPKDFHSKRGLLKMVAKRRRLLSFLKKEDVKRHNKIAKEVGLMK